MEDLKALTECAECTWDYIDRLRMALAYTCKERDELKKELAAISAEYKMWGNGISLPTALYVMQGIADALKGGEG